jgi:uncharacterized protein involved in outer membrane biogenesis
LRVPPPVKKILKWLVAIVGALLLLFVVLLLFKDTFLRKIAEHRLERETGLAATIGRLDSDLLAGSIRFRDIKLFNSPEFGGSVFARIPELYLRLDNTAAASGPIRLHEARVTISELNVIKNAHGRTNILELHKRVSDKHKSDGSDTNSRPFGGIGEFRVTLGTLRYTDVQQPTNNHEFDVAVKDEVVTTIKNKKDFETWATMLLIRIVIQQALLKAQTNSPLRL